ncbi:MAG: hypothetical protein ACPGFC_03040 [Paracoccaceae bacterium]
MPDLLLAIEPHIINLLGAILTFTISTAALKFRQWTGINIEEKHRRALHEALMSGAAAAREGGISNGLDEIAQQAIAHAKRSVPDAIASLRPSEDVLQTIAARYAGGVK